VTEYCFVTQPDTLEATEIEDIHSLYASAGWWDSEDDPTAHILDLIRGSHCFLIAAEKGRIVGIGRAISDRISDAYIQDVTVAKEYRLQGIGLNIIKQLVSRLRGDGIGWVGVIAESNSHAFYENVGFRSMVNCTPLLLQDA